METMKHESSTPWGLITAFCILIASIISAGIYFSAKKDKEIKTDVRNNLTAIADLKIGQITNWLHEREGDALMIQNSSAIARMIKSYFEKKGQREEIRRWIEAVCNHNGYASATIYDSKGVGRFNYGGGSEIGPSAYKQLQVVMKRQKYGMSDLHISRVTNKVTIGFLIPLIIWDQKDHPTVGVLFFRIDPFRVLYPLIQSWPTPSPTAETLLVRREGDDVVFLNELRHRKGTALTFRLPITKEDLPAALAAKGVEAMVEGVDYRGIPVLAVMRKVPNSRWFMVAKMDTAEVYGGLRYQQRLAFFVAFLLIIASGAVLGLWWRNQRALFYRSQYQAELERRALLQHYDYLVKYANDMIFLFDVQGKIIEINDQACRQYGYLREELLQMNIRELRPPELQSGIPDLLRQVDEKEGIIYEVEHVRKDGTRFSVEVSARLFVIEGHKYLQAIIRDISERKQAEKALRESEGKFRRTFDLSPVGAVMVDLNYRFIRCNEAYCRFLKYSEEELIGKTFLDVTHPEDTSIGLPEIARLLEGKIEVAQVQKRYIRKDGEYVWGEVSMSIIRDDAGNPAYFLTILQDINQRKLAEDALSAEKERLAVTLRSIGDGVITTDVQGTVTMVNKAAEEMTGWSSVEALGRPLSDVFYIINEHTRERCENPVDKVLKSGMISGLANHTALVHRDGREMIIADSGAPIRDRESKVIGVVLVFRDITDKKKADLALQNAGKLEAIGALAGGIAHDFNNLLGGIFGYLELVRIHAAMGDGTKVENSLSKAFGVFDRAKSLTQQLLIFSKGGSPIRKTQSLAEHVRKTVSFALSGSNISPVFAIPDDIWACDFDENQMAQVFDNVVINARQAMPLGGQLDVAMSNVPPEGTPRGLLANAYVSISIRDYGSGIQKEHLSRIFEPFFTTKQQGSGLGLATSYSIVKKHDGLITVESQLGKGTTFMIYLPASSGQILDFAQKEEHLPYHGHGRILVMDDEVFILDVLSAMLTEMGYQVIMAENGDEAIAHARRAKESGQPFQAAILDLTIPGGRGGEEIVHTLLEIDKDIKVVASSGYSEHPVMAKPSDYGFANRLVKPYRRADVIAVFESLLK